MRKFVKCQKGVLGQNSSLLDGPVQFCSLLKDQWLTDACRDEDGLRDPIKALGCLEKAGSDRTQKNQQNVAV